MSPFGKLERRGDLSDIPFWDSGDEGTRLGYPIFGYWIGVDTSRISRFGILETRGHVADIPFWDIGEEWTRLGYPLLGYWRGGDTSRITRQGLLETRVTHRITRQWLLETWVTPLGNRLRTHGSSQLEFLLTLLEYTYNSIYFKKKPSKCRRGWP